MRTAAERRHTDWAKAIRKKKISDGYSCFGSDESWYDNLHQYSKSKIHCSCGICSRFTKTNNKGRHRKIHGNYAPSKNWSPSDTRKRDSQFEQINELTLDENSSIIDTESEGE